MELVRNFQVFKLKVVLKNAFEKKDCNYNKQASNGVQVYVSCVTCYLRFPLFIRSSAFRNYYISWMVHEIMFPKLETVDHERFILDNNKTFSIPYRTEYNFDKT